MNIASVARSMNVFASVQARNAHLDVQMNTAWFKVTGVDDFDMTAEERVTLAREGWVYQGETRKHETAFWYNMLGDYDGINI